MLKIGIIGDWDSIYGFGALGLDTFRIEAGESYAAKEKLHQMAKHGYEVIYITEALAKEIPEEIEKYRVRKSPALILIPGILGNTGEGMSAVKKSVEQAVGTDIIGV